MSDSKSIDTKLNIDIYDNMSDDALLRHYDFNYG